MKTVHTILPIYDNILKQDYRRTRNILPVLCPRQRLPSWQYILTNAEAAIAGDIIRIDLVNAAGTLKDITAYFPVLCDDVTLTSITYYKYDGDNLNTSLPLGCYYLKITHTAGGIYIYYSEWFSVIDIYPGAAVYSADFIRIDFKNTNDLGDIYYQNGFSQTSWLHAILAPPLHEQVDIGEEKNGIFVAEKIVTKFKFRILAYIGRELYRALIRLPQHDDIDIIDEVGNTYSPAVGNIKINTINWQGFDYGQIEILFNNNEEIVWVSNNSNLT